MKRVFVKQDSEVAQLRSPDRTNYIMIDPTKTDTKNFAMGITEMSGNSKIAAHAHDNEEEILFIYEGKGLIEIEGKKYSLEKGVAVFVPVGCRHSFINAQKEKLCWVWVFSPPGYEKLIKQKARNQRR